MAGSTIPQVKLAIVDDHNLFRKGLITLINLADKENRYTILFEAESGLEMKQKLNKKNLPDIILMDINMPDMDGYEVTQWLKENYPGIKILVITMIESENTIIRMLRLGIKGYLLKNMEVEDMQNALDAIVNKGYYYSDLVTNIMANTLQSGYKTNDNEIILSLNEAKFLQLACTDMTYIEIAAQMNVSPKTIDNYREALFQKFNVKSRVSLAVHAIKNGLYKP